MTYEDLLKEADNCNITVKEKLLKGNKGRIKGNRIAIKKDITIIEKTCVLAEELGHHHTSTGCILNQCNISNKKQEAQARLWAYNKQIGLIGIIHAFENGCQDVSEMADFLNVTENFLNDALDCYRRKYGIYTNLDNYTIHFEPNLYVAKHFK